MSSRAAALIIAAMLGCLALALARLGELLVPRWDGSYLLLLGPLTALEASYSYHLARARRLRGDAVLRFRLVELGLLALLVKIGGYSNDSWTTVLADIRSWGNNPLNIISPENLYVLLLIILFWDASTISAHELALLEEPDDPPPEPRLLPGGLIRGSSLTPPPPLLSLRRRFFSGGALLLIVAGLLRLDLQRWLGRAQPFAPELLAAVLLYFLLGLLLLGQARLATLHQRWQSAGLGMGPEIDRRWLRFSLLLIGLAGLLALALPTGYASSPLELLRTMLGLIAGLLVTLMQLLLFVVLLLFYPLGWLLSQLLGGSIPAAPEPPVMLQPPPELPTSSADWTALLRALLFWMLLGGLVLLIVRSYLRDHPELWYALGRHGPLRLAGRLWRALWASLARLRGGAHQLLELPWRWRRGQPLGASQARSRLARGSSAREHIRAYYLALLQRAARQGLPRRRSQTPYEYDRALGRELPEAQRELSELTEAFVQARYSQHDPDPQQLRRVRTSWRRIRAALRGLGRR